MQKQVDEDVSRGPSVGARIREQRLARQMTLRELARQLSVSPSFLSQLETGKSQASVATLYAICDRLGIPMDQLFARPSDGDSQLPVVAKAPPPHGPVVQADRRPTIELDSGVTWQRLTSIHDDSVDFMRIEYAVGGQSTNDDAYMRHNGTEYHFILSGQLRVHLGFETYEVGPGDAISFESSIPHRLVNVGGVPVVAITAVVGRGGDTSHAMK